MPEWLINEENYKNGNDKDSFLQKSILSMLSILSRVRAQEAGSDKFYVHTVLRLLFTIMLLVVLSASKSFTFVIVINVYILAILSLMRAEDILGIIKVSFIVSMFTLIVLLPAAFWGNSHSMVMITLKAWAAVSSVGILSHSTRWSLITGSLKRFFVPDIFILVLDITIKYIVMLGDFSLSMLYALKLRSVGRNKSKYESLSGIAGTMFIKSKEMAEDMYQAMECRGFTGEYRIYDKIRLGFADVLYVFINVGILAVFLYLERV